MKTKKKTVFEEKLSEYLKAKKKQKGVIIEHVRFATGMHRKAIIRKFNHLRKKDPWKSGLKKRGRHVIYGPEVTAALRTIWEAGNEVCGELLSPIITEYANILARDDMWPHSKTATASLLLMSESTIKRRIATFMKARRKRKGLSSTRPSHIKYTVPIFTGPWKNKAPGYGQIDTVRHNNSATRDCVYTLNYTDAATLVTRHRAQWNKSGKATEESMRRIRERMPFPWLGAHPDSGSEFINRMVIEWCKREKIELSRSRPNRKNDNMLVEERNGHTVRKFIGYVTLDCTPTVDALNAVYDTLDVYLLHFVAVRRMTGKARVDSQYKRKYEKKGKTPYWRILEHAQISEANKEQLRREHEQLNPLVLKREFDARLKKLYDVQRRFGNSPEKF